MFFWDVLKDSLLDTLKMLPFLLIAFFLLEFLEHRAGEKTVALLRRSGKAGPAAGAVLGLLPQCGFSIMGANFFADHAISMGTLIAVFLSTSDEAIIILLAEPERRAEMSAAIAKAVPLNAAETIYETMREMHRMSVKAVDM